jgi:hypothetical protein
MQKDVDQNGQSDCSFSPGELICESGLYEVCHTGPPRSTVILIKNDVFPSCEDCGEGVRFKLIKAVPHVSEDPDFVEFVGEVEESSPELAAPGDALPTQLGLDHGFRYSQEDF